MEASALHSRSSEDITPRKVGYMLKPDSAPTQPDLQDIAEGGVHRSIGAKTPTPTDQVSMNMILEHPIYKSEWTRVECCLNVLHQCWVL